MLKSIYNFSLMDLLPDSLTRDPQILACIEGLDDELRKLSIDIRETLILSRIDELPEDVIDLLAWQFDVPFYQPAELDLSRKRALVKNAIADHRIRGTPAAVEKLLTTVFNNAVVKEWWEYDGDPYTFRIEQLGRSLAIEQDFVDFELALDVSKNTRSHLESFTIKILKILEILYGFVRLQSKTKRKLYRLDLKPSMLNSTLGLVDIRSIYRIDKPRIGAYIPQMTNYLGFIKHKRLFRMNPALDSDLPIHDLRSTSILDLLILGLGILRESLIEPNPIWTFADHTLHEYIGIIQSRDIRKFPSHNINLHHDLHQSIGFVRSKEVKKIKRPSFEYHHKIALGYYIFVTKLVSRFFGAHPEPSISATISKDLILHNYIGFATIKSEYRRKKQIPNLESALKNYIGAINIRSISKRKILDTIEKAPIIYRRDEILNIFAGFARILALNIHKRQNPRNFFNIDLKIGAVHSKSIEKSKLHRVDPIQATSRVFIGAVSSRFVWRKFKPIQNESFYRKRNNLQIFVGFSRFKHIHREIRDSSSQKNHILNLINANIVLKSLVRKNLRTDSDALDRIIQHNSTMNLTTALVIFSHRDKFSRQSVNLESNLQSFIGAINLRSISKHAISRDSPTIHDQFREYNIFLKIFAGLINLRAKYQKHVPTIRSPSNIRLNIASLQFRAVYKNVSNTPKNSNLTLPIVIGCLSLRSVSRGKISEYRLGLIHSITPDLMLFSGFIRIRSHERRKISIPMLHQNLNFHVGIARWKFLRRENHATAG